MNPQTQSFSYAAYAAFPPPIYLRILPGSSHAQDIVSLVVQAIGGGMAATAVNKRLDPAKGGNVMLGGIIFQMGASLCPTYLLQSLCILLRG
jgi:hypothetical protein